MIDAREVYKSYGDRAVLRGMTFSIDRGEIYGLLGPNGAGKTTMINILCSLLAADSGQVLIGGNKVSEGSKFSIGIVSQEVSVYRDLTCRQNLLFFSSLYGIRGSLRRERVDELIVMFDLAEYANTPVSRLSGGWQRRLNIAVALVHAPSILILDEPTAGLDVEARYELWQVIDRLSSTGAAILLTTHQLDEAERLCSRFGIISEGRVICDGSLDELRSAVPAEQLAVVVTDDEAAVEQRASSFGWATRRYGGRLTLLLPRVSTLREIVQQFEHIPMSSVTLQQVGLDHIYVEATSGHARSHQTAS